MANVNELVSGARSGNPEAQSRLAEVSFEVLRGAATGLLPSGRRERYLTGAGGVQDLVSDIVLEAVYGPALESFDPTSQTWEGFIVQRLRWRLSAGFERERWWNSVHRLRGPGVTRQRRPQEEGGEVEAVGDSEEYSERVTSDPLDLLAAQDERRSLRRAIRGIRNRLYRRALILHELLRMPYDAIAVRLGVPEGTARCAVHRALRQLRRSLEGDC